MANFKKIDDLHDYTRKLMEDDWNHGQHFVFKLKNSMKNAGGNIDLATTLKLGHVAQAGENHTVKLEQKSKGVSTDLGGMEMEIKATNDGKLKFSNEFQGVFKDVEGFENSAVTMDGTASAAGGLDWEAGVKHSGKDHFFNISAKVQKDPVFKTDVVWRPCDWFVVAERSEFNTKFENTKCHILHNMAFQGATGLHSGGFVKATHKGGMQFGDITMGGSVNHTSGNNTAGAQVAFDYQTKAVNTILGLQLKQDDHTWKFMAHSSGMSRALLQWQLHRCCKASINTAIDLGDIPSGKISALPWGYGFEVKY